MSLSLTFYSSSSICFSISILYLLPFSSTSTVEALSSKPHLLQATTTTSTHSCQQPTLPSPPFTIEELQNTMLMLPLKTPRHRSNGLLPIPTGMNSTTYSTIMLISRKYSSLEAALE
ncbi:hypothetical protein K1719_024478 [Acacia pycnantha]|nr:hypothetical protein K1719_024264 [Acacia pycnantha]KAI9100260.1 hypothetical protein K1719_024478 [Acacia pycnantha]